MAPVKHSETDSAIRRHVGGERTAGSFLVRVWYESRESASGDPSFRGYVRNLQTGEERFVRDPATVTEQIVRQLEGEGTPAAGRMPERRAAR
jgi:hypothetical protein